MTFTLYTQICILIITYKQFKLILYFKILTVTKNVALEIKTENVENLQTYLNTDLLHYTYISHITCYLRMFILLNTVADDSNF